MLDHLVQLLHALLVGRDLGLEVGQVVVKVARRIGRRGEQLFGLRLHEPAAGDQLEVVDQHAFLVDVLAGRRHRARRDAADFGVVPARGDVEENAFAGRVEDRRDHGHVGQMGAAVVRRVQHEHIARHDRALALPGHGLDALAHGAEVHRDVRRVRHQVAFGVEDGTGKVEPLLDIDRVGGVLQHHAGLLGDRHEQVVEHLEHDRVGLGADLGLARARLDAGQDQVVARRDLGGPAGLDHGGGDGLDDDRRPLDHAAGAQALAVVDPGRPGRAGHEGLDLGEGFRRAHGRRELELGVDDLGGAADDLDDDRLDDVALLRRDEAVLLVMHGLEGGDHGGALGEVHDERRIRALVAHVRLAHHADAPGLRALAQDLGVAVGLELVQDGTHFADQIVGQDRLDRALAHDPEVRQAHAVGREHAGEGMDEHARDAERVGDQAGMLAAGAAEAVERVFGHVVAALDRDLLDRVGHVVDRDLEEALGGLLGRATIAGLGLDSGGEGRELLAHHVLVERLVAARAEDLGEETGPDLADHQVGVGHRERPAAPVARGTGIGARRIRADPVARPVEVQDRAAAGGDGVDAHHRRAHAHPGNQRLERALEFAVVVGDVGRGAAHVEADDLVVAGQAGGAHRPDHAAGRTGQDAVLAVEVAGVGETAVGLHEHEPGAAQVLGDAVDVAAQDR